MLSRLTAVSIFCAAMLGASGVSAQAVDAEKPGSPPRDVPPPHVAEGRPSIGLVLSGGGARGGAHIGVIKALQELRVPIDEIAGTSIGAVVGGFYVSGMTVNDMVNLVDGLEWEAAFLNVTPRRLKSFHRKRDDDLFLVDQKPGLNKGQFQLPFGFVQGQVFDTILSRETLRASRVDDFDHLILPFRAVASDLATGEPVVLRSGSLSHALRASMSIPAALTPIEIDGRLLVDGGVSMNLPVEVAQSMGANIVIAVDISTPLRSRETITSVLDVTTQLTNLLTRNGTAEQKRKLGPNDILIEPQFSEDLSSLNFAKMKDAIQSGYDAVMARRADFEKLALSPEAYEAYAASLSDPRMEQLPRIDFIKLDNNSTIADSVIETRLSDIELGAPLDVNKVERAMNRVYGLEYYQNVRYGLVTEDDETGLQVELDPRSWGPNYLQLGMEYNSAGDQDALFGLAVSYLRTAVNELGGEWRATAIIGDEPAFMLDRYQPFGRKGLYFYAPSLDLESVIFNVYDDGHRVTEASVRSGEVDFAVGRELPSWGEYRFGLRLGKGHSELRVGDPTRLPEETFQRGEFFGKFAIDTMDDVSFPRSGTLLSTEVRGSRNGTLNASADFDQLLIEGAHARTWGRHTMLTTLRYDATISGVAPLDRLFRMGGFFDISGLNRNQLTGQYAMRVGAAYYRRIGDLVLFPAFAGVTLELGNVFQSRRDVSVHNSIVGGSFWAGVSTPVGPVYVGYGRTDQGTHAFYVSLGRVF
jgi:NTE family protein